MHFYYSQDFNIPLPPGHRFPGRKYVMLAQQLLTEGVLTETHLRVSPEAPDSDILIAHDPAYLTALVDGTIDPAAMRRIGFPWSELIHQRGRRTIGGAIAAARAALQYGLSGQLAGGTHHAHRDFGAGFCVFNDFATVALKALQENWVERVAIIDLDVHQGDGNAAILQDMKDVFILDIHGEKNFPFRKVPSTLSIPLPDNTDDSLYLSTLEQALPQVWNFAPDLVLYQAGVDPLEEDRLGRMSLTFEGLMARDRMVLEGCRARAIPCSMAIGGGYSEPIEPTVIAYANTYRVAKDVYGF